MCLPMPPSWPELLPKIFMLVSLCVKACNNNCTSKICYEMNVVADTTNFPQSPLPPIYSSGTPKCYLSIWVPAIKAEFSRVLC